MKHEAEVIDASQEEAWRDRTRPVVPRIAFVSGGMGGIGSAICQRFAQSGHTVVAGCLPGYERKQDWLDAMRAQGFRVHAAEGDVADFDSCAEMFYNVSSVVGPVDILVNNAGITRDSVFKRMAVTKDLGLDPAKVNPNGGAVALGHPIGATGAILTVKALYELERIGKRYALVTMCIGGGQGIAAIFERA